MLNLASYRNSLARSTKSTLSGLNALQLLVGTRFQVLFHSPPGVLFTFPSRYFSSIGHQVVFSLGRWSSLLPTAFLVFGGTLDFGSYSPLFVYGTLTLYGLPFHTARLSFLYSFAAPKPHLGFPIWFGLFPVRSPLLGESILSFRRPFSFSSSGYLDVSVPRVCLPMPIYSA